MNKVKELYKKYSWKLMWKLLMLKRKYFSRMLGNLIVALDPIVMGNGIVVTYCMDYSLYQMVRKKGEAPSRPKAITLVFRVNNKTRERVVRGIQNGNKLCVSGTRMWWPHSNKKTYLVERWMVLGTSRKWEGRNPQVKVYDKNTKKLFLMTLPRNS